MGNNFVIQCVSNVRLWPEYQFGHESLERQFGTSKRTSKKKLVNRPQWRDEHNSNNQDRVHKKKVHLKALSQCLKLKHEELNSLKQFWKLIISKITLD